MVGRYNVPRLPGKILQGQVNEGTVAKMRGEGGMHRIREEGPVLGRAGFEAEVPQVVADVVGCVIGGFCAGEVRVEGQGAEVGGESVVGGRG